MGSINQPTNRSTVEKKACRNRIYPDKEEEKERLGNVDLILYDSVKGVIVGSMWRCGAERPAMPNGSGSESDLAELLLLEREV
jgi:hypothetical protein